jgi:hypothetical protein
VQQQAYFLSDIGIASPTVSVYLQEVLSAIGEYSVRVADALSMKSALRSAGERVAVLQLEGKCVCRKSRVLHWKWSLYHRVQVSRFAARTDGRDRWLIISGSLERPLSAKSLS